jgi:translation initiation factor 1
VTLLKKLVLSEDDMRELATRLKQLCGSGGTVKDGMIEIQGGHREKIAEALKKMGYKVKIAGG